jgi:formylglycine-generating enzyme required for sulfatase activity
MSLVALAASGCQMIAGIEDLPGPAADAPGLDSDGGAPGTSPETAPGAAPGSSPEGAPGTPDGASPTPITPPSCDSLPKTCGPDRGRNGGGRRGGDRNGDGTSDCCESPQVPGGSFLRNYDGRDFTSKELTATVHPFRLDRFEVTVGRFRNFVGAFTGGWRPAVGAGKNPSNDQDTGWTSDWSAQLPKDGSALLTSLECNADFQTYTRTASGNERRPINCVSWQLAYAFCVWDGGRLPTDAEWNFAAAGGDEQRYYPWNADINDSRASYYVDDTSKCMGDGEVGCTRDDLTPVGTHDDGTSKWGQSDMSGNVTEWVRDGDASKGGGCVDCIDPVGADDMRRARGGSYQSSASGTVLVAKYLTRKSTSTWEQLGFRCARTP